MTSRSPRTTQGDDDGQVLLRVLCYTVHVLLPVAVLAAATAVHLARPRVAGMADAAAVAAADTLDRGRYFGPGGGAGDAGGGRQGAGDPAGAVPLTDAGVRAAATEHVAATPRPPGLLAVAVADPTGTPDGTTAEVTLAAVVRPPGLGPVAALWGGGVTFRVTGRARAAGLG